jgi:hypothetical protein
VLLFNGDWHLYRSDNPLSPTAPCDGETDPATGMSVCAYDPGNTAWSEHPFYNVPNFHRVVVHGSTFPLEWLKLTIDPDAHYKATATQREPSRCTFHASNARPPGPPASPGGSGWTQLGRVTATREGWRSR